MNIEKEIFQRTKLILNRLIEYGFIKDNNSYIYEKYFLDNEFKAIIIVDNNGTVTGKVYDLQLNEEYTNIRTKMTGEFVSKVKDEYKNILIDIKNNCYEDKFFINNQANEITRYIKDKYSIDPEFLWEKYPFFGIFRNKNNNKWFALITNVDKSKIDEGNGKVELLNIKLDSNKIKELLQNKGYYEAYHMNKKSWISIILNNTLKDKEIFELIDESYNIINKKGR